MKCKLISDFSSQGIEDKINSEMEKHDVHDVKYQMNGSNFTALILYRESDNGRKTTQPSVSVNGDQPHKKRRRVAKKDGKES